MRRRPDIVRIRRGRTGSADARRLVFRTVGLIRRLGRRFGCLIHVGLRERFGLLGLLAGLGCRIHLLRRGGLVRRHLREGDVVRQPIFRDFPGLPGVRLRREHGQARLGSTLTDRREQVQLSHSLQRHLLHDRAQEALLRLSYHVRTHTLLAEAARVRVASSRST